MLSKYLLEVQFDGKAKIDQKYMIMNWPLENKAVDIHHWNFRYTEIFEWRIHKIHFSPSMSIYFITGVSNFGKFWEVWKMIEVPTNQEITNDINNTKKNVSR